MGIQNDRPVFDAQTNSANGVAGRLALAVSGGGGFVTGQAWDRPGALGGGVGTALAYPPSRVRLTMDEIAALRACVDPVKHGDPLPAVLQTAQGALNKLAHLIDIAASF